MKLFNEALTMRYTTLERNIKSKSNSFYDSYLDLLEATIKYMLDENGIVYDENRTCGFIVRTPEARDFFITQLKMDDYTISKVPDYVKKCNDHKHKKEKTLMVEAVINYLKVYFDIINYYLDYIKGLRIPFDASYFTSIYGETERLNNQYLNEVIQLKEELRGSYEQKKLSDNDLKLYKSLASIQEVELLTLDEQNKALREQINTLKDIKLNSMEEKLNKALDMLVNLNGEILENRIATDAVYRSITGGSIKDEVERLKGVNHGDK